MHRRFAASVSVTLSVTLPVTLAAAACVPSGSAGAQDSGTSTTQTPARQTVAQPQPQPQPPPPPPSDLLKSPFEDDFEHPGPASTATSPATSPAPSTSAGETSTVAPAATGVAMNEPGPDWATTMPGIWHIEGGRLCGEQAKNHGIWLKRTLPINARIEFDAISMSPDGDLKAELWGDGRSAATSISYTNATSYLTIFGGWHNKFHVLARINEHGTDRKEIVIDPKSDDPREKPVVPGQRYHFKVERNDGKTVKWWVDGNEMLTFVDAAPLSGIGHDHFGFNDWDVKVCFDNVRIVPLP
jgi:hypothetical protein